MTFPPGRTPLELLAPAKNLECGMAAIDHGADAVYIGAPQFGARASAGNSLADIATLCQYAHQFCARVYVTVNTLVYESELDEVRRLLEGLCDAGADAVLVQDMALLALAGEVASAKRSGMALHASTQTDNRFPDKVRMLRDAGCSRVVLARELPAKEMADIHAQVPDVELEAFVHGALCVSYSGLCYASQYCFSRSANRGACAQFCRLRFELVDAEHRSVDRPRHWLSLRDMCRLQHLEEMAASGVVSFKIEGRLKDAAYVKNVVAAYHEQLDRLVAKHPDKYCRSSLGRVRLTFTPNLRKTFNRGFTDYFISGRGDDIASPDTPKALGEYVGKVKEVRRDSFNVAGTATFANGDGLCFFDKYNELHGFRVNRAEGNRIYPHHVPPQLSRGMALYRNADALMEKTLSRQSAVRKIPVTMTLAAIEEGYQLQAVVPGTDLQVEVVVAAEHQMARQPQGDVMRQQLSKLGTTVFEAAHVGVDDETSSHFIPSSQLSALRRKMVEAMQEAIVTAMKPGNTASVGYREKTVPLPEYPSEYRRYPYLLNIANSRAKAFYTRLGVKDPQPAFELGNHRSADGTQPALLMQCKHCIRRLLGYCKRDTARKPAWREPLYLQLPDQRRFRLQFDCQHCQMNVYAEN